LGWIGSRRTANTTAWLRVWVGRVAGPAITVLLSVAAMAQALQVWQWRPGDPVDLSGDSAAVLAQIKDILDHGWYGSNPDLGAPFHQDASWLPLADHLHLFLLRLIGFFSDNPFTVGAIYFFLGFPLAALSMYWLARQRHLGRLGSVVAAVLFSVVPGHQTMFQHLMLASYWVVPLGIWLVLRAAMGEPLFRIQFDWRDSVQRRTALPLNLTTAFCVLSIAIGGIYYSAFTLLLLAMVLLVRLVATRDRGAVARATLLLVAIGTVSLAAVESVAAGQDKSTLVKMSTLRGFWEPERYAYAGKLMDLILPWIHHRVAVLQHITVAYNGRTWQTAEQPALGVIALAGVVALMVIMLSTLVPQRFKPAHPELAILGLLTVEAISLFSIGGLGSLVSLFVTSQIRTWSRLFVIIALFGLLAVGYLVTVVSRRNRKLGLLTAGALLVIGVLDQTNSAMAPNYQDLRYEVEDLTTFSQIIAADVGPGCSVFQLPVVPYPENPPVHDMADYAHFRPYLVSRSLRWSYGAFRGTSLADWQLALPQKSTATLLDDLVAAGFCAVEVDRAGFVDRAATLDANFRSLLGPPVATTYDDRLLAWNLAPQRASLTSRLGANEVKAAGDMVLHPVIVYSDQGAGVVEHDGQTSYQRTAQSFEIDVHNFGQKAVENVRLTFSVSAQDAAPRHFTVHAPGGGVNEVDVDGGMAQQIQLVVAAAPGRNAVTVTTTGEAGWPDTEVTTYGNLIDLRASVPDPTVQVAVVQQRIE
jgi:hypothetical protein